MANISLQVEFEICKLNQLSGAIHYLAKYINPKQVKQIYYAFMYVFLFIKYGIELYGTFDPTVLRPLHTAQTTFGI